MKTEDMRKVLTDAAEDELFVGAMQAILSGQNKIFHNAVEETVLLDDGWISAVADSLFSIENIVRNPRKFIAEEDSVVEVERAKRTTAKTVRHLASHSRDVSNIVDGEVRPKRVLTTEFVEDLAIYENRFVYTLISRLVTFVEARFRELDGRTNQSDITNLCLISDFRYGNSEVHYHSEVSVKEPPHDNERVERIATLLDRIEVIRKRLRILQATAFYRELAKAKPVRPPIMKTNLLRSQLDYKKCYQLWLFISAYDEVGFSAELADKNLPVDGDYFDDLAAIAALSLETLFKNNSLRRAEYEEIPLSKGRKKDFRTLQKYSYVPAFRYDRKEPGEEAVNEFYYQKMREAFKRAANAKSSGESRELSLSFARYYRAVSRVNAAIYDDLIRSQMPPSNAKSTLKKLEYELACQQLVHKRYGQLNRLRREELARGEKEEYREKQKMLRLELEVAAAKKAEAERLQKLAEERENRRREREAKRLQREIDRLEKESKLRAEREEARKLAAFRRQVEDEQERVRREVERTREREQKAREAARAKERAQKEREEARAKAKAAKQREAERAKARSAKQREAEREKKRREAARAKEHAQKEREEARAKARAVKQREEERAKAKAAKEREAEREKKRREAARAKEREQKAREAARAKVGERRKTAGASAPQVRAEQASVDAKSADAMTAGAAGSETAREPLA